MLSGDAAGEVALWNVATRRVVASWQPHAGAAILKVQALSSSSNNSNSSDQSRLLTQGRDGALCVWDASQLNCKPRRAAGGPQSNPPPGLLATLYTGSYNFCKCATVHWVQDRKLPSSGHNDVCEPSEQTPAPSAASGQSKEETSLERTGIGGLLASQNYNENVLRCESSDTGNAEGCDDQDCSAQGESKVSSSSSSIVSDNSKIESSSRNTPEWVATACSEMPTIQLWDIRNPQQPVVTVAPSDSTPKTGMLMCLDLIGCKSDIRGDSTSDCTRSANAENRTSGVSSSSKGAASNLKGCSSLVVVAGYESGHILVFDLRTGAQIGQQQVHQEPVLSVVVGRRRGSVGILGTGADTKHNGGNDNENRAESTAEAHLQVVSAAADAALAVSVLDLNGAGDNEALLKPASARLPLGNDDKHPGAEALAAKYLDSNCSSSSNCNNNDSTALLACGGWDRRVRLFEWEAPHRPIAVLKLHTAAVAALAWNPDGSLLASASRDGNIALWGL